MIFCEVDCKNKNDYRIFAKLKSDWEYASCLENTARWKYINQKVGFDDTRGHYLLMRKNGEIISICRTSQEKEDLKIDYLESKPQSNYRFAGQMILAGIAKEAIKNACTRMTVPVPVSDAWDFYEQACGFREFGTGLVMDQNDMINFISNAPRKKEN